MVEPNVAAFELSPIPQAVVDEAGVLAAANREARALLGQGPSLPPDLRAHVERARAEAGAATWDDPRGGGSYDLLVAPLGGTAGVVVAWVDAGRHRTELERAYEELRSSVEELRSTNGELETASEELRLTTEDLRMVNAELVEQSGRSARTSAFLSSVLSTTPQSLLLVDVELKVRAWSDAALALWGLRAADVEGRPLLGLEVGLPLGELRRPIRSVLAGGTEGDVVLPARAGHGCTVSFAPVLGQGGERLGALLGLADARG